MIRRGIQPPGNRFGSMTGAGVFQFFLLAAVYAE